MQVDTILLNIITIKITTNNNNKLIFKYIIHKYHKNKEYIHVII